jgi:imidazolonepropionase-like amidohydrolase
MTPRDLSEARNPVMRASFAALQRAAALARKTAIQTDTGIVLVQDGKVVHISAAQLRAGEG